MNEAAGFPGLSVRALDGDDAGRLSRLFGRLSPQTVYRRFFTLFPAPPPGVLEHLAAVDHCDHEGLAALDGDEIVAVARWDRTAHGDPDAEVSIVVEDAWQHRGLGGALMRMLVAEAVRQGITTLNASILTDNGPARRLATSLAPPTRVQMEGPVTHFTFRLAS
jgi:GNAT superfamily N-acetyltransferase